MRLARFQTAAINDIIQEEVQKTLQARRSDLNRANRDRLFESVAGIDEKKAAAKRISEAAVLLAEARDLLGEGTILRHHADEIAESAYALMGLCEGEEGEEELDEADEDVVLPPMHPRGREEQPAPRRPAPAIGSSAPAPVKLSGGGGYPGDDGGGADLPPMHPRGRR